jgi:RNA-directed DNA polymerase
MAVEKCRQRCWTKDWVLDLDVQKFFDSVDHNLMVKAVEANTDQKWVVLHVRRWLKAPIRMPDGRMVERNRGTPQGSAVSPVLANLFMHYAFDLWLEREFPAVEFERFADDAVVHCATERQAYEVLAALSGRLEDVGLRLHPDKTKVVYCKDRKRWLSYERTSFTFLGYTFRARKAPTKDGKSMFSAFLPAISRDALKDKGRIVRRWRLHLHTTSDLAELAEWMNPIVAGWMNY